ncbi:uncharacterized protein [Apostichopus japonicus]|uniref:uncharacterized protein n=1 Tax=Stichopus japonicus TaxID=307972 RepID=UPI003AB3B8B6
MEAIWKNIFQIDSNVKKSPLLTQILFLLFQGSFTKEYCYQNISLNFSLTDNVYVFWKLWKYWNIDNWCRKFERKDVVFDREAPGYSEDLVKDVCTSCKRSGVILGKLTFRGDFPPSIYKTLPDIETDLIFENVKLQKSDYINIFRPFEGKSFKIRFSDTCPSSQFIERIGTNTIRCDALAEINQYYWYMGSTSETDPILNLVNGKVGGSKYNDGHYDITPTGDMKIKNAQLEHEATYTFVAFFTNDSFWTRDISVIITNTPTQLCPSIPACAECGKCEVIQPENEYANLTCFIEGVRPQPVMYWTYEGVANVTKNESHSELTNHTRDTWTVSTIIVYKMPCGETTVFNCYIYSDGWLLNLTSTSKVEVNSERCHDMSTEKPLNVSKKVCFKLDLTPCIFIWVIIFATAIICTVISICLTRSYTTSCKRKETLKDALQKYYLKQFNYGVNSSYAVCDCVIRISEEDVQCATSDDILKKSFFNNNDFVIFTGKVGFGKTYLFQHVTRLWAKGEILQNAIVIYIKLKPFCKRACILERVVKSMDGQFKSVGALSSILQERECLLLLDGFTNLTLENSDVKDLEKGNSERDTQSKTNNLYADNCMLNNLINFKKLTVWVTCRQLKTTNFIDGIRKLHWMVSTRNREKQYCSKW